MPVVTVNGQTVDPGEHSPVIIVIRPGPGGPDLVNAAEHAIRVLAGVEPSRWTDGTGTTTVLASRIPAAPPVPRYDLGAGIRPPRRGQPVRAVVREVTDGGHMELWHCDHNHAPGVRDMRHVTSAQLAAAHACARAHVDEQITAGLLHPLPIRTSE